MAQTYYWNCKNSLGAGKKAIKEGDKLPDSYAVDPRLKGWLDDGVVSKEKPTPTAKLESDVERLRSENLDLAAKIKVLTDRIEDDAKLGEQNKTLSSQNKALNERLENLTNAMMDNEAKIAEAIRNLIEERVSKDERLEVARSLENLEWPKDGEGNEA